ncbi:hypothetical protein ACYOEI_21145 [Singulisphaera rosea]
MGLLRVLSTWLIPWRRSVEETARTEPPSPVELDPIDLTPVQAAEVEARIREVLEDSTSVHACFHEAIARENVLPLLFGWDGFMAMTPGGRVVWVSDEEPEVVTAIQDERLRNIGRFRGARLHPGLSFLLPARPTDAVPCPDCQGTGRVKLPKSLERHESLMVCYCGGLGWLPGARRP